MTTPLVQLTHATIRQGTLPVLTDVNLRIGAGEFVYLIGKTGSGKSTLLKALYGALPLGAGSGTVAGHDLTRLDRHSIPTLRRQLGIVFQDFNLLADRSVAANLDFVLRATGWRGKAKRRARITEVLTQVDLADSHDRLPHLLSGGEQQRVVIARALLNSPPLLLADEPTGNLDPETSDDILYLLRKLAKEQQTAVLFATHDYRILDHFPGRIVRVVRGGLVE